MEEKDLIKRQEDEIKVQELVNKIYQMIQDANFYSGSHKIHERRVLGAVAQLIDPNITVTRL